MGRKFMLIILQKGDLYISAIIYVWISQWKIIFEMLITESWFLHINILYLHNKYYLYLASDGHM